MNNPIKQSSELISAAAKLVKEPCLFTDEDIEDVRMSMESLIDAWQVLIQQIENEVSH